MRGATMSMRRAAISATPPYGIDDEVVADAARDHVHPKVTPAEVVFERDLGPALDREVAMTAPGRPFAARQRDVGVAVRRVSFTTANDAPTTSSADRLQPRDQCSRVRPTTT